MRTVLLLGCLVVVLSVAAALFSKDHPVLRPWPANPWYWSLNGQPVLLLGGSDDDNLFQWSEQKLVAQLDRLAAAGGNYIRNTMSDRRMKRRFSTPSMQKALTMRMPAMVSASWLVASPMRVW